ncbi:ABC transporter ATP-binding protein [Rubeoparvulum massiliense]|uniref:ABC transporter ATP-binding protein n=1 Tax=Rubeoparvulum massiliense TaxID=1631346 RepID=UPI00065DD40A|nr:ABC transporter ATP-binding protein [Rubeoparvulum massiliense]
MDQTSKAISSPSPLLKVKDLSVSFRQYTKGLRKTVTQVISNLDVEIHAGEVLAVVGSSGSGKSLLAHAILGILPANATITGILQFRGEELTSKKQAALRGKQLALIPQSVNYLDPLMQVGKQVQHAVRGKDARAVQEAVFARYQLVPEVASFYPFQLSGGMARRVLIANALVRDAQLIIADEPTTGLDGSVIAETLGHFRQLADEGRGVMMITHDIEAALSIADRIAIFYAGTTVEIAPVANFCGEGDALRHPYSRALWQALPQNQFRPIPGFQPQPHQLPTGCLFHPRCSMATAACKTVAPEARQVRGGMVRCLHAT